jgi:tripeptidyl-peptidase-1
MEISDPNSEKYGQHMSPEEVGDLFRPSSKSIESLRDWLHSSGIETDRHQVSPGRGWLKFDATIEELESLLSTEYHVYEHVDTKELHIGCDEYHVPHSVHPHVDFISPTVSTLKIGSRAARKLKRAKTKSLSPASFPPHVQLAGTNLNGSISNTETELPCHTVVTPNCIRGRLWLFGPGASRVY